MRRRSVIAGLAMGPALIGPVKASAPRNRASQTSVPVLDSLAMPVMARENRQYSYTDKQSAYFHGRTHTDTNPDWFNGWNIATKRILHDYALSVDGVSLSRAGADVVVSPHKFVRQFSKACETLSMLDNLAVLIVAMTGVVGETIGLALKGDLTDSGSIAPEGVWFLPKEAAGTHLLVAPIVAQRVTLTGVASLSAPKAAQGFYLIHAASKPQALGLLSRVRRGARAMLASRASRMEALVSGNLALDAGDPDRTKALLWMRLTADQLVTKQMGTGIYAGLPWFNDYWGRDTFISITGTLFITGQYEVAADVFRSFAALQDVDPNSKTFGRVPNRARPDGIEYNSADGTPRFIITLADLVNRSGNVALARELWPAVRRAVEGVLKNNVDELGLITHDDADTWMDAKEKGLRAWSPRGNRAIDVQALWLEAFGAAGVILLGLFPSGQFSDAPLEVRIWTNAMEQAKEKLRASFAKFYNPQTGFLVDHLRADGTQSLSMRPNTLFAVADRNDMLLHLLPSLECAMKQLRSIWEGLVYPWGVATLSQDDPNFYPYHEHWHYYHKDAAYHNGTVWPWLNGIAIQRMVEFNQVEHAWQLFENMNRQALREGAVGSLSECADALPIKDAPWSRRTGTFLQAWSNAEQLRVWQECFLGFTGAFDSSGGNETVVNLRPMLPTSVRDVRTRARIRDGYLDAHYRVNGRNEWRLKWSGNGDLFLNFRAFVEDEYFCNAQLKKNWTVVFKMVTAGLNRQRFDARGTLIDDATVDNSAEKIKNDLTNLGGLPSRSHTHSSPTPKDYAYPHLRRELEGRIFANLDFCKPRLNPNLKSLSVRHDPPLTY